MKKICTVIIALSFTGSTAYGQLYIKGGLGYALSLGGMQIDRDRTETATLDQFKYHYGAFGGGFEIGGAAGYAVTSSVAFELGLWYEIGQTYKAKDVRLNANQNRTTEYSGTLFGFSPALIVSGEMGNMRPYARFGILIGLPGTKSVETRPNSVTTLTFSGGMLLGFQGGTGVLLPLQGNLAIFVELALQGGSWGPTKVEDVTGAVTTTTTLKSDFNSNDPFVSDQPSIPFGNIGVRAGVKLNL